MQAKLIKTKIKYHHVEKLGTDETDGILTGDVYVFPKIDGANQHVWFDGEKVNIGGRRYLIDRILNEAKPKHDFFTYANNNNNLQNLAKELGIEKHIFGEWLIPHTLLDYRYEAWGKFYIFDIYDEKSNMHMHYKEYIPLLEKHNLDYIMPLRIIKNPHIEDCFKCLEENVFLMKDGKLGEGVVLKNYDYVNRSKKQVWAKIVRSDFKEKHYKLMGCPESKGQDFIEEEIVCRFLKEDIIQKVYANIKVQDGWSSKYIPRLLSTVFHDFINEEIWRILKEYKNPKIDFKLLSMFTTLKVKEIMKELF